MSSLAFRHPVHATDVRCSSDELIVSLNDGRVLSAPLAWFPRLTRATAEQLADFELLGDGEGIHWPSVDEDISVAALLDGRRSAEYKKAGV